MIGALRRALARALPVCIALASLAGAARAQTPAPRRYAVIQLYNGTNVVDLVGDGRRGQVIVSHRAGEGGYDTPGLKDDSRRRGGPTHPSETRPARG